MTTHLKKILADSLTTAELELVEGSYDVVGDIAVVRIADSLLHRASLISEMILATNARLKVVVRKTGRYRGEFRTAGVAVIGGEKRTLTVVREFGLNYHLDIASCYFSVRSGAERRRIAALVKPGERVLVLFSGIAPFPLMIARHSRAAEVVGVEKSRVSHDFALKNRAANLLEHRIQLYCADALELLPEFAEDEGVHRLVMPLPVGGEQFLAPALGTLLPGGMLHFYTMARPGSVEMVRTRLQLIVASCGRQLERGIFVKAGHCGNRLFRYSFEGKIN